MESAEIPQVISDPVEYFDSNDRVLALMDMRRNAVQTQQQADELKATLCNKIRSLTTAPLRARIVAISEIDPELTAYIMALESINAGVWCPKCKTVKKFVVGATPSDGQSAESTQSTQSTQSKPRDESISLECTKLQAHINTAKEEIQLIKQTQYSLNNRSDLLTIKIDSYQKRLDEIARVLQGAQVQPQVSTQPRVQAQTQQSAQSTQVNAKRHPILDLKKEDLPPAPTLDININFDQSSTADSLLE